MRAGAVSTPGPQSGRSESDPCGRGRCHYRKVAGSTELGFGARARESSRKMAAARRVLLLLPALAAAAATSGSNDAFGTRDNPRGVSHGLFP